MTVLATTGPAPTGRGINEIDLLLSTIGEVIPARARGRDLGDRRRAFGLPSGRMAWRSQTSRSSSGSAA